MNRSDLPVLRAKLGLTQTGLADLLGITLRAYQAIEAGDSALRPVHVLAIERATMKLAAKFGDPDLMTASVRDDVSAIAAVMRRRRATGKP